MGSPVKEQSERGQDRHAQRRRSCSPVCLKAGGATSFLDFDPVLPLSGSQSPPLENGWIEAHAHPMRGKR